jgi:hypothetical protein
MESVTRAAADPLNLQTRLGSEKERLLTAGKLE